MFLIKALKSVVKNTYEELTDGDGKFDVIDVLVPLIIQGLLELFDSYTDGDEMNVEWQRAVQAAYYDIHLYYSVLVTDPENEFTDEILDGLIAKCEKFAAEGDFALDIPTMPAQ